RMDYQNKSDHVLLLLLKQSDHRAYTVLYKRYSSLLYAHVLRRLNDREEAKDIIHELFTYLWLNREHLEIQGHLSGYLYTAARNRVIKVIARKVTASQYIDLELIKDHENIPSDHLVRENQLKQLIEKEIAALPTKMQEVVRLSRKEYLSHKENALHFNISEFTSINQMSNDPRVLKARLNTFPFLLAIIFYL